MRRNMDGKCEKCGQDLLSSGDECSNPHCALATARDQLECAMARIADMDGRLKKERAAAIARENDLLRRLEIARHEWLHT
jgi:hypothetical protein